MNTTGLVMTVTDELLAELETLAERATEAPWEWDGRKVDSDGSVYIPECSYLVGAICLASDYEGYQHDCDYIAAAKPDTMKALTTELRRLRAENAELAQSLAESRANDQAAMGWLTSLRWASGDRGERMLPELVEHIEWLVKNAWRYKWLRNQSMEYRQNGPAAIMAEASGEKGTFLELDDLDAAIDTAMATQ